MLNPIEEARFQNLKDMCRELKVPAPPEIFIGLKVHDQNGVLVFDDRQRGHSWTRNFWNNLYSLVADVGGGGSNNFSAGYMSSKNSAGVVFYVATYTALKLSGTLLGGGFHNNTTTSQYGIVVGTGDTAFDVNQYALVTQIIHGASAAQFSHVAMVAPVQGYTGGTKTWKNTASRIFNNNSGGAITVKEVGLYTNAYGVGWGYSGPEMIERSVLSPAVAVANGAQLTVSYEISMDFSAID